MSLMAVVVAVVRIAKRLTTGFGPKADLTQAALEDYLKDIEEAHLSGQKQKYQQEVDQAVSIFVNFHTVVALLQAATGEFEQKEDLPEKTISVAAFDPDEVGEDGQEGRVATSKTVVSDETSLGRGKRLVKRYIFDGHEPVLRKYLTEAKLPPDFVLENCLETCLTTVQQIEAGRAPYLLKALVLIRSILAEAELESVQSWFKEEPAPVPDTATWLTASLDIDKLKQQLEDNFANLPDSSKLALSRLCVMLDESRWFFNRVFANDRPEELSIAIKALPTGQEAWKNLLPALYGAIAWRIYYQLQFAVREAQIALTTA